MTFSCCKIVKVMSGVIFLTPVPNSGSTNSASATIVLSIHKRMTDSLSINALPWVFRMYRNRCISQHRFWSGSGDHYFFSKHTIFAHRRFRQWISKDQISVLKSSHFPFKIGQCSLRIRIPLIKRFAR